MVVLKILIAAACVAAIAYVGFFFFERYDAARRISEEAIHQQRLSRCTRDQIESARAFALFGKAGAASDGYPNAEADAENCL